LREPTPIASTLAYWRAALAVAHRGDAARDDINAMQESRLTMQPECGFYRRRIVKDGPFVPVRFWLHQQIDRVTGELTEDERLRCQVNGQEIIGADNIEQQWVYCANHPISEAEFAFMCARADWAEEHAPNDPHAQPQLAIDWDTVPMNRFQQRRKR